MSVSKTTPELWEAFTAARSEHEYYQGWLALQSRLIPKTVQSVLVVSGKDKPLVPVATWPQQDADPSRLSDAVERVFGERCGMLLELRSPAGYAIAYPVLVDDALQGIVALEITAEKEGDLQMAMEQLQWGTSWLELLLRRKQADKDSAALVRLKAAVDLLAVTVGEEQFSGAATAFVTELSAATDCDRVSLGFLRGRHIVMEAVSNSADFSKKMNLARAIGLAMDEAVLQRQELIYPPPQGSEVLICREHENLSRQQNNARLASFPLFVKGRYYGALTCERPMDRPFASEEIDFFRAVAALAGPALEDKEKNDRSLPIKIRDAAKLQLNRLFGPRYLWRKLWALLLLILIILFSVLDGDYRLSADTTLEGAVRRVVVAPFDGYIDQAPARAGDLVEKGHLLCSLDDRDLRLEKLSRISQRNQLQKQYEDARAKHDRAQANIIRAQLNQAQAELDLIEAKLERSRLAAPFKGLLVSGDLSQRLGGAVQKGEVLFEVTPLDAYRVILEVDERRIGDVNTGQQGSLMLSSQPDSRYSFTITKITPITTAEGGRNYFRVEARLESVDDRLRPGMEGVGKIVIDRRRLIGIWTRALIEWLQLWSWRWLP